MLSIWTNARHSHLSTMNVTWTSPLPPASFLLLILTLAVSHDGTATRRGPIPTAPDTVGTPLLGR